MHELHRARFDLRRAKCHELTAASNGRLKLDVDFASNRDAFLCIWGQHLDPDTKVTVGEPFPVAHAHHSALMMLPFAKHMWTIEVGGDRLVFNAGEITGDVYTAMLDNE